MRVLIVGGTGVISTAVSDRLIATGHQVTHLNRGQRPVLGLAPHATIRADRTAADAFVAAMREAGPWDCVYDMVCFKPEEADAAVRAFEGRTGLYAFCSTVDVYAKPAGRYPIQEDEPHRPVSAYGFDKARCEAIFMAAHAAGRLPVTVLRPAYTHGEGSRGILHSLGWTTEFLDRLAKGRPVIVHGDGTGLWTACHAADAAGAFAGVLANPTAHGRAYNVVSDDVRSWDQYVQGIARAIEAPEPEIVHIPTAVLLRLAPGRAAITAANFQFANVLSNARAKAELGFAPQLGFEEGMRRTYDSLVTRDAIVDSDRDPDDDRLITAWRGALASLA